MASNLYEYYKAQGQTLPSVQERQGIAQKAGISNYTGDKSQNDVLLKYLTTTPQQGGNNVITADSLNTEKPIQVKEQAPDTSFAGTSAKISTLANTTKANAVNDEKDFDLKVADLEKTIRESGDQTAINEAIYKKEGVDVARKTRDKFITDIEAEQLATAQKIEEVRKTKGGTTAGMNAEIARIQRESAAKLANLGIGLSASSRDYQGAYDIASRQITANSDKLKADIEARKFVLEQLGTKLATEKANAFTLQLKQIDNEDKLLQDAIKTATDGAKDGTIDGNIAFKAVQDLTSGKISISQFYSELGVPDDTGIINGYDITSYATDPAHEQKVISIYNSLSGDISSVADANAMIKNLAPDSPLTGKMILDSASKYNIDPKLLISILQQDSNLGTKGLAVRTKNAGNYGNDDAGNIKTFNTWAEGVDAVAGWLNRHRATKIYRGEFASTIDTIVSATNESQPNKNTNKKNIQKAIAEGDYSTAYKQIENTVSKVLTGENKTQYDAKRVALPSVVDLEAKLKAYEEAGGKMGLLKGSYEKIVNRLGEVNDPKYKALAADLRISLQKYRKDLSGAAFSEQEARDYASVNPAGTNSLALNLAIISGMKDNFQRQLDSTVDAYAGDGAQFIREYARSGTSPNKTASSSPISTPTGNSFTIPN